MKFVNKEDIIEAVQFTGDNLEELRKFLGSDDKIREESDGIYFLSSLTKLTKLYKNNYILKKGNQNWICDSDKFTDSYLEFKENELVTKPDKITLSIRDNKIINEELDELKNKYNVNLSLKSVDSINIIIELTANDLTETAYTNLSTDYFTKANEFNAKKYVHNIVEDFILKETYNWTEK